MTPERFRRLTARFERLAATRPVVYRLCVAAFGAVGFLAGVVLRATAARHERPHGVPVTRAEAPRLFEELDRLRALAPGPRLHAVLVSDELDAGVWQTPLLGHLGWPRNELAVGYPLLAALGVEELRAVLAHELAHLAGRHAARAAWVFQVRRAFDELVPAFEARPGWLDALLGRVLAAYRAWFAAASVALAREGEREADRVAARVTGARATADALVATRLAEHALALHHFPALRDLARADPAPPEDHLAAVPDALRRGMSHPGAELALLLALDHRARPGDSHPALADRLLALGEDPRVPERPARSAAELLLGEAAPRIRAEVERRWREAIGPDWAEAHARARRRTPGRFAPPR